MDGVVQESNKKRTFIGKFIHSSWSNINIRAGKYRHLGSKIKNKCYLKINVSMSLEQFKEFCFKNELLIKSLKRPSIDRINSDKDYSVDNIRVIELSENIKNKRQANLFTNSLKKRGVRKVGKKFSSRITINRKEVYLGTFVNKEDAYTAFYEYYLKHYNKKPW